MPTTHEDSGQLGYPAVPEAPGDEAATRVLIAENQRLQERVKQLEEERERDRQQIGSLQGERDAYRRAVYAWALDQISDEDLEQYAQDEEGLPLDEFIGELERPTKVSGNA